MTAPTAQPLPPVSQHRSRPPTPRPRRPDSTGHRLRQQWLHTIDQPWAVEVMSELPVPSGTLPDQLPAAIRADRSVAHACIRAAQGEGRAAELSGQALLQVVFPMLVRMAARDPHSSLDDYLAEAWIRLRTLDPGPATTVPTSVGLDALHAVCQPRRRLARREVVQQVPEIQSLDAGAAEGRRALELLSAAVARGILTRSQLPVLVSVYLREMTSADAAARHRISATAVRARCSRATRTMRRHAELLRDCLE